MSDSEDVSSNNNNNKSSNSSSGQQEDGDSEARLLVHQSSAGAIIGRAGFKIKELREKSKAQIKVYTECCPNSSERVVQFNGTAPLVVEGIRRTLKVVQDAPIKGPVQFYDPFCYGGGNYGGHYVLDIPQGYNSFPPVPNRMGGPDRRGVDVARHS
ncbi:putative heterogeneous nuclear ribonucleoprotein K-like isoform X1 [Apostichopus japonicus]|uniref:Putative heterogeneous nuclear ribonucleoprotein K-like isoform X1 n=1 Tax=Stichopus japonicus TaxID=307972 RepID=A0A2G8L925_STIJA|nr:putative heterogeneous nuclear ribonucleoprotein K-like isoform X1 [Apostichopus japonicus]